MKIEDSFKIINENKVAQLKDGKAYSVEELWNLVVKDLLLPKSVIEKWFNEAKKYIDDPDAVFFIRTGNTRQNGDAFTLRRGFYTKYQNSRVSFVYDDNDIATYMYKLAYDGNWTPSALELKEALKARTIPIKFTPSCKEEKAQSAYVLTGKAPEIGKSGYKVSHIIDAGTDYDFGEDTLGMAEICSKYFQIGNYSDWVKCEDGYYLREFSGSIDPNALKFLKAHFLRLTCPLNYILTPKKDLQVNYIKIPKNDVGELKELQAYAVEQFKIIYDSVYDEYLSMLMLPKQALICNPGSKKIDVHYGFNIKGEAVKKSVLKKTVKKSKADNEVDLDYNSIEWDEEDWDDEDDEFIESIEVDFDEDSFEYSEQDWDDDDIVEDDIQRSSHVKLPIKYPNDKDENEFKNKLLKSHHAEIIIIYNDGKRVSHQWNATRFSDKSNVNKIISSEQWWRKEKHNIKLIEITAK